jgi:hypothetical protein
LIASVPESLLLQVENFSVKPPEIGVSVARDKKHLRVSFLRTNHTNGQHIGVIIIHHFIPAAIPHYLPIFNSQFEIRRLLFPSWEGWFLHRTTPPRRGIFPNYEPQFAHGRQQHSN